MLGKQYIQSVLYEIPWKTIGYSFTSILNYLYKEIN